MEINHDLFYLFGLLRLDGRLGFCDGTSIVVQDFGYQMTFDLLLLQKVVTRLRKSRFVQSLLFGEHCLFDFSLDINFGFLVLFGVGLELGLVH